MLPMFTRRTSVALALTVAFGCSDGTTRPSDPAQPDPSVKLDQSPEQGVIVMLANPQANPRAFANDVVTVHGGRIRFVFEHGTRGFSAYLPAAAVVALRNNPMVKYVEPIGLVMPIDHAAQQNPTWGINRIDQRALPLDALYRYSGTGTGVSAYIIDTGILTTHNDFGGRASVGVDATGGSGQDCTGHGTRVAGTVGGSTYGVAKQVQLVAVRVLDCDPFTPDLLDNVLSGIDWVIGNHSSTAVANISLAAVVYINGVPHETTDVAFDNKVADLIAAGVPTIVAAGNQNKTACGVSPARVPSAITVGATTSSDSRASFSNIGACLDLFAPGQSITSAWWTSNTATNTQDGTSFAAPHVTGVAALYLQRDPTAVPSQVSSAISSRTTPNRLTGIGAGSPNLLLHSLFAEVTVSGPASIQACNTYVWAAAPSGVGTFTYQWELYWYKYNVTENLGTGQTASRYLCPPTGLLTVRVTATTNFGFHATGTKAVFGGF